MTLPRSLLILIACYTAVGLPLEGNAGEFHRGSAGVHGDLSPEADQAIQEAYNGNTEALWRLRDRPLRESFEMLEKLSYTHGSPATPERQKLGQTATEVLLNHPDLESYLSSVLDRMNDLLLNGHNNGKYRSEHLSDYSIAASQFPFYIAYAANLPDNRAFRIVGRSLLSAVYYPPKDYGDAQIESPGERSQQWMSTLALQRLGESIPKEFEEARKWWHDNEWRFQEKPALQAPAVAELKPEASSFPQAAPKPFLGNTQSPPSKAEPNPSPSQAQIPPNLTERSPFFVWFLGTVALLAALIGGAVWAVRSR